MVEEKNAELEKFMKEKDEEIDELTEKMLKAVRERK